MSGYYYPQQTPTLDDDFDFDMNMLESQPQQGVQPQQYYQTFRGQEPASTSPPGSLSAQTYSPIQQLSIPLYQYPQRRQLQQLQQPQQQRSPQQYLPPGQFQQSQHPFTPYSQPMLPQQQYQTAPNFPVNTFVTPTVPSNYDPYIAQPSTAFPQYSDLPSGTTQESIAGPSGTRTRYLSPDEADRTRISRSESFASSRSDVSRSASPNASEMRRWGIQHKDGTWTCRYPGCSSRSTFSRGCDLRKHYKRHTKSLFCRVDGCPQATEGGFSSKKDRARHEAKHNPSIVCEWEGCDRLFSRADNMKDHVRRVHKRRI